MKFLTKKQVEKAAKKGHIAAAKCSWEHHNQLATCTEEELRKKIVRLGKYDNILYCAYCALCKLNSKQRFCGKCRLGFSGECCDKWLNEVDAFNKWYSNDVSFSTFQKAAAAMQDYIAKKYPEIKK